MSGECDKCSEHCLDCKCKENPQENGRINMNAESEGYKLKLLSAEKAYYRGGGVLKRLLSKPEKHLSGEEALSIFNTYAIAPYELKLLLMSHGFEFDESDFLELLIEQKKISKTIQPLVREAE